ncbi:MAG: hypothetical protein ABIQ73_24945 [Acidimicrobiales bacterium]
MVAAGGGAAIYAFAANGDDTITVWKLASDWDDPRGPSRKTRLTSNASRTAAENRYALTESDALDMNLHVGSWAPALAVVVNRNEFEALWDSLSYDWHNPWNARDVRLFDARHAARDTRDANLLVEALAVTATTTSTTTTSTTTVPSTTVPSTTEPATTSSVPPSTDRAAATPSTLSPPTTSRAPSSTSTREASSTSTNAAPTTTGSPGEESRPEPQWSPFPTMAPTTTSRLGASRTATPKPVTTPPSSDGSIGRWVASLGVGTALVAVAAAVKFRRRGDAHGDGDADGDGDSDSDNDTHLPPSGESTPSQGAPGG